MRFHACMVLLAVILPATALAQRRAAAVPGSGIVNLPYVVNDSTGNQWMVYQTGWLRQQGPSPLYGQGAMIMINGNQPGSNTNQARIDAKTGELLFEDLNAAGILISRRVQINRESGLVRYIDTLTNPQPQDQTVTVTIQTSFNYGASAVQMVSDPRRRDKPFAWVAQMQPGRALVEIYAARGAKNIPTINHQQNNNFVQATMQVTIPAGKQVALLHLHGTAAHQDAGVQLVNTIKTSQLLAEVPGDLRKIILNAATMQSIGDRELLRGGMFDVVELRSGDQIRGTIQQRTFKLETFYGPVELAADRVVALINVGQYRPRQLLVTVDGEVFGGGLADEKLSVQLSSGQTTQVPLAQISRLGYRKRAGEPDEWPMDRAMIVLRSGERMLIAPPAAPITVLTRYGTLQIRPESLASIEFVSEEHGVHEIHLKDGSRFAGLVSAEKLDAQLVGTTGGQVVGFVTSVIERLQLAAPVDRPEDDAATLELTNQDIMVGTLSGQLRLDTAFDTIAVNGSELRAMTRTADGGFDVQLTLWDQTTISGQLEEPDVTCDLSSGVTIRVPVALVQRYDNPQPRPSETMVQRVKAVIGQLSADDWKQREQGESQLVSMGPAVMPVLRELSGSQPPEAQQRIESVLKQLQTQKKLPAAASPPVLIDD